MINPHLFRDVGVDKN